MKNLSSFKFFLQPQNPTNFNKTELQEAITLQKKAYQFLQWIAQAIDKGQIHFTRQHANLSPGESTFQWIKDNEAYIPPELLPKSEWLQKFSNYFGSYVTTSFVMSEKREFVLQSYSGCWCDICTYLSQASHLQRRKLTKASKREAKRMLVRAVMDLVLKNEIELSEAQVQEIVFSSQYVRSAAYLAYTKALLERINGSPGGLYVLALWRMMAWKPEGSPIKGFRLEVDDILEAKKHLLEGLRKDLDSS